MEFDQCKDCKRNTNMVFDNHSGDVICEECGLVMEERIVDNNNNYDYRVVEEEEEESHDPFEKKGENLSLFLADTALYLGTLIRKQSDLSGIQDSCSSVYSAEKYVRLTSFEKKLQECFQMIEEIGSILDLNVVDTNQAFEVCRLVLDSRAVNSKNPTITAAACIFVSCTMSDRFPRKDIHCCCENVSEKELNREIAYIEKEINGKMGGLQKQEIGAKVFIKRYCSHLSNLNLPLDFSRRAYRTSVATEGLDLRRSPLSVAAAVIYFLLVPRDTIDKHALKEISAVSDVSRKVIFETFKDLLKYEALLAV